MANPAPLNYVIYIAATPEKVWDGFVSPESNRIIFLGAELEAEWKPGGPIAWVGPGPDGEPMKYFREKVLRYGNRSHQAEMIPAMPPPQMAGPESCPRLKTLIETGKTFKPH